MLYVYICSCVIFFLFFVIIVGSCLLCIVVKLVEGLFSLAFTMFLHLDHLVKASQWGLMERLLAVD